MPPSETLAFSSSNYYTLNSKSMSADTRLHRVMVSVLEILLSQISPLGSGGQSNFDTKCRRRPTISLEKYFERINVNVPLSEACFVSAMIYISRLQDQNPGFHITDINVHRLFLTSIMIASKYLEDAFCTNTHWSKVGGITVEELNNLEKDFLFLVDFDLYISSEEHARFTMWMDTEIAVPRARKCRKVDSHTTCTPVMPTMPVPVASAGPST